VSARRPATANAALFLETASTLGGQAGGRAAVYAGAQFGVNRLSGDKQPGAAKTTFTTAPTYKPDAPLRPSGLIGPVTLLSNAR
jgi:hypothetical protein